MAFKLDDFLTKKKEPTQVLDLSKVKITSKEEFKRYLDKVPEFKIKPEKVVAEGVRIRDKDFSFVPGKREERQSHDWSFPDPTPPDMRGVKLEDLCPVNIDWKMLTTLRPKTKVEEEMFSRLVQLGKLDLKYRQALAREKPTDWIRKTKNPRSSIIEVRVLSCKECGEDFCDGSLCSKLMYDNFSRAQASASDEGIKSLQLPEAGKAGKKGKKKHKRKKSRRRRKTAGRKAKPRKNSIFNRPPTKGCSRDHSRRGSHAKAEAQRSSSLNRIQEKKPTFLQLKRSKSAPRLQTKRESSDPVTDLGATSTDYTDSESSSERRRRRRSSSARVGFLSGRKRRMRTRRCDTSGSGGDATDDSSSRSRPGSKPAATIRIEFDGFRSASSAFHPRKSYVPNKLSSSCSGRSGSSHSLGRREITRIVEGFAKIDLSLASDAVVGCSARRTSPSPKRRPSVRFPRSRTRSDRDGFMSTCCIKGRSLLAKLDDPNKSKKQH